jgi:hypothetical protein
MFPHRLLLVTALLAAFHGQALAQGTLIEAADPAVRAELLADGGEPARVALDAIAARGAIDRGLIARALAMPLFARHARATLIALSKVDTVPGAKRTLERVVASNQDGNVLGAAFEIQVAALLGADRVAAIGATVDGHEVDLLLKDGTRVEVKCQQNDDYPELSPRMVSKATDQLKKRGANGDPVMLIANNPLSTVDLATFRREVGPASSVLVVEKGVLYEQLKPLARRNAQRPSRSAAGAVRRSVKHTSAKVQRRVRTFAKARRAR